MKSTDFCPAGAGTVRTTDSRSGENIARSIRPGARPVAAPGGVTFAGYRRAEPKDEFRRSVRLWALFGRADAPPEFADKAFRRAFAQRARRLWQRAGGMSTRGRRLRAERKEAAR